MPEELNFQELSKKVKQSNIKVYVTKGSIILTLSVKKSEEILRDGRVVGMKLSLEANNEIKFYEDSEIAKTTRPLKLIKRYEWCYRVIEEDEAIFYIVKQLE